ncbi:MAG: hypothetical protein AAF959_03315 [Cyanobacteria bacterium P01_D01_bin.56]
MTAKICAFLAYLAAGVSVTGAYSQVSALNLRQTSQPLYVPHHNMVHFGPYRSARFNTLSNRTSYGGFRGGGSGSGK